MVGGGSTVEVKEVGGLAGGWEVSTLRNRLLDVRGGIRRCIYCGRRLSRVITSVKPPRSKAVFRSVYKKYTNLTRLRFKVV